MVATISEMRSPTEQLRRRCRGPCPTRRRAGCCEADAAPVGRTGLPPISLTAARSKANGLKPKVGRDEGTEDAPGQVHADQDGEADHGDAVATQPRPDDLAQAAAGRQHRRCLGLLSLPRSQVLQPWSVLPKDMGTRACMTYRAMRRRIICACQTSVGRTGKSYCGHGISRPGHRAPAQIRVTRRGSLVEAAHRRFVRRIV